MRQSDKKNILLNVFWSCIQDMVLYVFLNFFFSAFMPDDDFRALSDERFLAAGGQAAFAMSHERFGR